MRSACAPVIAGLLLGCTPNASTQPPAAASETAPVAAAEGDAGAGSDAAPEGDAGAAGDTEGVAAQSEGDAGTAAGADGGTAVADAPEPDPAGTGTGTPGPGGDAGALAAADGGKAPESPEGGTKPTPEPSDPVAKLELPKPLHGKLDASCGNDPGVGERLKSFSLPAIEGDETVTHSTFKGRVLVVNFWGTWCKPCLKELPEFDQLYRRYRKHGMTLLAIATDEDPKAVKDLVTEKKWGAKIAIAGETYAGQYGSAKFPFTFVVDHKGVIQASYRGYKPECMGQLEADIREQLTARADAKAKRKKG